MKKMTVRKKIIMGFGIMILLSLIVGGVGIEKTGQVADIVSGLRNANLPLTLVVAKLDKTASQQELDATLYVIHGKEKYLRDFESKDKMQDRYFQTCKEIAQTDANLVQTDWDGMISKVDSSHNEFAKAALSLMEVVKTKDQAAIAKSVRIMTDASDKFNDSLDQLAKINEKEADSVAESALEQSDTTKAMMKLVTLVILGVGIFLAFFITRSIIRPVQAVIEGILNGADQVASASDQISSGSQSLAEGASEQAASIEETSSSLEEISSMTRQNAENADIARAQTAEAREIVGKVNQHMEGMVTAMGEVSRSSEETGKIIKTIDEIAFQTNLLALNAAVEAARAGEAGAGFAVVADEVRSLAMRAAEAAKNTADLIENTTKAVIRGKELTQSTQSAFKENMAIAEKVGHLVDEIATASGEQTRGIGQVNTAVAEMNKVVQQNAANAEQSASAAEEMNAQAEQMKGLVAALAALVDGGGNGNSGHAEEPEEMAPRALANRVNTALQREAEPMLPNHVREIDPNRVIPMDAKDFRDF